MNTKSHPLMGTITRRSANKRMAMLSQGENGKLATPHSESLEHIAGLKIFEQQRHHRSMDVLNQIELLLKTYVADLATAADAGIKIEALRIAPLPSLASGNTRQRGTRIENMSPDMAPVGTVGQGLTEAIKMAIRSFAGGVFLTHQISDYVRNNHPHLKADSGTVSKRLYQLRKAGLIEVPPGARSGRGKGGNGYRAIEQST